MSQFISHLYSPPKRTRPPIIQISTSPEDELPPEFEGDGEEFSGHGYAKEMFGEWISDGGIGARKYDDLTAIGIYLIYRD